MSGVSIDPMPIPDLDKGDPLVNTKVNEPALVFFMTLLTSVIAIGICWHLGVRYLIPPSVRIDMWALAWEHWGYRDNFSAYLAWRWPPLIAADYPLYFTLDVLPGVLVAGAAVALLHRRWIALAQAGGGWLAGAVIGYVVSWAPLPNALFTALVMPVMAFVIGSLTPVVLAPQGQDRSIVRGTRIVPHKTNSARMIARATARRAVTLAGLLLDRPAEVRHISLIGVTGSGKSTAIRALMATATRRGDRHVVADPDGSAMSLFHQDGDVILNPFDARSAKWDILAEIREDTDYRFLTESVLPFSKGGEDSEWVKYAREIFVACLRSWHLNRIGSSDAFFAAMATAEQDKLAALCEGTGAHRYFETGNERMLGSILGTMSPALESMRQLAVIDGAPFSVRRWLRDGTGSLWMPYQAQQIPALRGLVSCWMGLAIAETLSLPDSDSRRIWFHVDELDALGRIQNLKDAQTRVRKKGGCVVLGFQSIAQVRAVYGDAEAHTIVENCDNKLILRCGASENGGTAAFASTLIGDREIRRDETSTSRTSGGWSGSTSSTSSIRWQVETAVLPSEIMRLPDCHGYLKVATQPDWKEVDFKPVPFGRRIHAYEPVGTPIPAAAE
jgi:hypothetical protein